MALNHTTMHFSVTLTTDEDINAFAEWMDNRIMNSPRGLRKNQHVAIARLDDEKKPVRVAMHGVPDQETEEIIKDLMYMNNENQEN